MMIMCGLYIRDGRNALISSQIDLILVFQMSTEFIMLCNFLDGIFQGEFYYLSKLFFKFIQAENVDLLSCLIVLQSLPFSSL